MGIRPAPNQGAWGVPPPENLAEPRGGGKPQTPGSHHFLPPITNHDARQFTIRPRLTVCESLRGGNPLVQGLRIRTKSAHLSHERALHPGAFGVRCFAPLWIADRGAEPGAVGCEHPFAHHLPKSSDPKRREAAHSIDVNDPDLCSC